MTIITKKTKKQVCQQILFFLIKQFILADIPVWNLLCRKITVHALHKNRHVVEQSFPQLGHASLFMSPTPLIKNLSSKDTLIMNKRVFKRFSCAFALLLFFISSSSLHAQTGQWAIKMFSELGTERVHDFGSVALNANVVQSFKFKNIYNEDVVISSVSSNCGCTKASASKNVIHPNETAEIIAKVDTSGQEHTKQRKATIKVLFSKPNVAEVQLQVKTYIRPDVGFEPGQIEFGTVQQGNTVVKKAFLQYVGKPDWALIDIQKTNPSVRAEAREVKRENGNVVYEIQVELKADARPGYIQDLIKLQTNELDRTSASIFLPIQGLVLESLSAKPSHMQLGVVPSKREITKNLVISGSTPFRIVDVETSDSRISFLKTNLARTVHVVPITFRADDIQGNISTDIVISTKQAKSGSQVQTINVPVSGFIVNDNVKSPKISIVSSVKETDSINGSSKPRTRAFSINKPNSVAHTATSTPNDLHGWEPVITLPHQDNRAENPKVNTETAKYLEKNAWRTEEIAFNPEKPIAKNNVAIIRAEVLQQIQTNVSQVSNEEMNDGKTTFN